MRLLTTPKERAIRMKPLRQVSKVEKIMFPIIVTLVVGILLPDAIPLLGMLMLGNLFRESGVVERLSSQAQNGLINTVTIFLGIAVGCKAKGEMFLAPQTIYILLMGVTAFICGTVGGLLVAKLMCKIHQFTMLCAPVQGQAAATEALRSGKDSNYSAVAKMRDVYDRRRRICISCYSPVSYILII